MQFAEEPVIAELRQLETAARSFGLSCKLTGNTIGFSFAQKTIAFHFGESGLLSEGWRIRRDQLSRPQQLAAILASRLGANRRLFARLCEVQRISRDEAHNFLENHHLMGGINAGSAYGLIHKGELIAVAAFSKGRKMTRLKEEQRSFELMRFATKRGITVTGGLSKLLNHFIKEKHPGDVMTYVDKDFSEGITFKKLGFKQVGETDPEEFLVDARTMKRLPKNASPGSGTNKIRTSGNWKFVLFLEH